MIAGERRSLSTDDRGVTELVSYVLIFSLVIATIGTVTVLGMSTLMDRQQAEQLNNVERSFDVLADNLRDIQRHGDRSRSTEMRVLDGELRIGDPISITVGTFTESDGEFDAFTANNRTITTRTVVYQVDDRKVVYEAGLVYQESTDSSWVVREPPIVSTDDAVTIPLLQMVRGGGEQRITESSSARVVASTTSPSRTTTLESDEPIAIRIESSHVGVWNETLTSHGFETERKSDEVLIVTIEETSVTTVRKTTRVWLEP